MAISKVVYGKTTLLDLTADTVTADTLAEGATAHDAAGNAIQGVAGARVEGEALVLHGTVTNETLDWRNYQWPILVASL